MFGPAQIFVDFLLGTRTASDQRPIESLVPVMNIVTRALSGTAKIIMAPTAENPDRAFRSGVDDLSRLVPILNASGQFRSEFVTQITGVEPGRRRKGTGIRRGPSSGTVSRSVSR